MKRRIPLVLVAALALLYPAAPAPAHSTVYYPHTWNQGTAFTPTTVGWYFGNRFGQDTRVKKPDVLAGQAVWNARNQSLTFVNLGEAPINSTGSPCVSVYTVHDVAIDGPGDTLATTWTCWNTTTGRLSSFKIHFDYIENWYTGTGAPSSTQTDLFSVAVHEFGHAGGFTPHFDTDGLNSSLCQVNSTQHTMCMYNYVGTTWQRTLEDHDIHTFEAAY